MKILLIESSSAKVEFGYAENNELILSKLLPEGQNADMLVYNVMDEFAKAGIQMKEIEVVSLSNGPGSFTGLRIGSAVAKGICLANNCKLVEIPTLDIIANKYKKDGEIISLVFSNSRTNEFYFSEYKSENLKTIRSGDYKIALLEEIASSGKKLVINDENTGNIPAGIELINLSASSNLHSQLELTIEFIDKSLFSDFRTSEPFYMKEFIPLKKSIISN